MDQPAAPYRFFGALRFGLAACVILQHFGRNIAPPAIHAALAPLALGSIAVLVFFALSGYIISEAAEASYLGRPGAFLVNRGLRIVPPYVAALTVAILVEGALARTVGLSSLDPVLWPVSPDAFSWTNLLWSYAAFLPGLGARDIAYPFIPIIWAVRAEVLFYLLFALSLYVAGRWRSRALGFAAAGVPTVALWGLQIFGKAPDIFVNVPFFVFGVAVFEAYRGSRTAIAIAVIAVAAMALGYGARSPGDALQVLAVRYGIAACLFLAFCVLCRWRPPIGRRLDQLLGDLSYPLYLNHIVVGVVFKSVFRVPTTGTFLAAIAASLAFSGVMLRLVEPSLRRLRARVRRGNLAAGPRSGSHPSVELG